MYRQFRRWTQAGLWENILLFLNDSDLVSARVQMIDSTVVRAHQQAAGSRGGTPKEGFGRSRGGFTTKIHLRVNSAGLPMRTEITGGEAADVKGFDLVMSSDLYEPEFFLEDKGYDADNVRENLKDRRVIPIIPMRRNRKNWRGVDRDFYRFRNLVERCFSKLKLKLKHSRRVATRYDKTALSFLAFVDIASIRVWLRFLST